MICIDCQKDFPEESLTFQTTIFDSIESYCEKCWDALIKEEKQND